METIVIVVHIVLSLMIIGLIMIQQGKGAEAGASFGGGASQTVFGSQGNTSFLSRSTSVLVALFFVTSLVLAVYAKQHAVGISDLGIPSEEVIKALDKDAPSVEEFAPTTDAPELDASVTDKPVIDNK